MTTTTRPPDLPTRHVSFDVPREGQNRGFADSWYAVCLSEAVTDSPTGVDFLDGRIVIYRRKDGSPTAVSAYCPHLGADLSVGSVDRGQLRCAFHGWTFDGQGKCQATGIGDPPPNDAQLFSFPTIERYGLIWVSNTSDPPFALPTLEETGLQFRTGTMPEVDLDPWIVNAHTMDLQHLLLPHDLDLQSDPNDSVRSSQHSVGFDLDARLRTGEHLQVAVDIIGTNIFWQIGRLNGRWFAWITGFSIPRPGYTNSHFSFAAQPQDGESAEECGHFMDEAFRAMMSLFEDDTPMLGTIHYRPGVLTDRDQALQLFLQHVIDYPHSHAARDFLK